MSLNVYFYSNIVKKRLQLVNCIFGSKSFPSKTVLLLPEIHSNLHVDNKKFYFQVKFLREYTSMSRNKVSQVLESLIDYTDTFMDFDPILSTISPSNPWITDDPAYWLHNQPL